MERGAARGQHPERGDRCQEIGDQRRRVQYLLEIVEHQQRRAIGAREPCAARQVKRRDVRESERLCNRRGDKRRIPNRGQRGEGHASWALFRNGACEL
jgi:hypothetical protein